MFVIDYSGVTAADLNILRGSLRQVSAKMLVSKNAIIRRALTGTDSESIVQFIEGPCSVVFSKEDPAAAVKILYDFRKGHEKMKLRGGLLKDKVLDGPAIEALAKLPGRDVLIAKAVGAIKAPLYSFVFVLNENLRKLVTALEEIRKKKEKGG